MSYFYTDMRSSGLCGVKSAKVLLVRVSYNFTRHNQSVARKASMSSLALNRGISEPAGDSLFCQHAGASENVLDHKLLCVFGG